MMTARECFNKKNLAYPFKIKNWKRIQRTSDSCKKLLQEFYIFKTKILEVNAERKIIIFIIEMIVSLVIVNIVCFGDE
jgi:hypothetical protein